MEMSGATRPRGRSAVLVVTGLLLGALFVRPAVAHIGTTLRHLEGHLDGRYVRQAMLLTRVASCNGFGFFPLTSGHGYTTDQTRRSVGSAPDFFACPMDLPQGATVKAVRFTLFDDAPAGSVGGCAFRRNHLSPPDQGSDTVASVAGTTETGAPGAVLHSTTTVATPVIDNRKFSYWAECFQNNPGVGVIGASVTYTISAAKG